LSGNQSEVASQRRQNRAEVKWTLILAGSIVAIAIVVDVRLLLGLVLPAAILVIWTSRRMRRIGYQDNDSKELTRKIQDLQDHVDHKAKIKQKE
jgi:uncharacterized protein HemY